MKLSVSTKLLVMAGILAAPLTIHLEQIAIANPVATRPQNEPVVQSDPRTVRLEKFFSSLHCPIKEMADDFIHAADGNNLDWRLLPSISIIESGGGKSFKNNNIVGWANGNRTFPTVRAGIHQVAFSLGRSDIYRDHSVTEKLRVYNAKSEYALAVLAVMRRISPAVELRPVADKVARDRRLAIAFERN